METTAKMIGRGHRAVVWLAGASLAVICSCVAARAATAQKLPEWAEVEQAVRAYFVAIEQPLYEILSRDQATAVLDRLARRGFRPADRKQIVAQVPAAEEFLVVELRTSQGRKFMAEIARYPQAYDRLERLSRLPRGKQMVKDLIRGPDGYKLIEFMTTSRQGRELGEQLSRTPKGKNFNEPTGRIYTPEMLLARLRESYQSLKAPQKKGSRRR